MQSVKDLIERIESFIVSIYTKTGHRYINFKSNKPFFSFFICIGYHSSGVTFFIELFECLMNNMWGKVGQFGLPGNMDTL